jgi:hypothetical protein
LKNEKPIVSIRAQRPGEADFTRIAGKEKLGVGLHRGRVDNRTAFTLIRDGLCNCPL